MISAQIPAIAGLSLEEKWQLAVELWNELEATHTELPTPPAALEMVEERFADYELDPTTALTLDDFKHRFHLP